MTLDELCQKSIQILKQTNTRRSAQAVFDVFFGMWNDGYFDGYGLSEPIKDEFGFFEYFGNHGNSEVYSHVKSWYNQTYGPRKQSAEVKVVTVSVGELLDESEKAYGFHGGKMTNKFGRPQPTIIWVPKSQVEYNKEVSTLTLPIWLAKEKNYMQSR